MTDAMVSKTSEAEKILVETFLKDVFIYNPGCRDIGPHEVAEEIHCRLSLHLKKKSPIALPTSNN